MSNRLKTSSSLYLRQHADNPVEWWPWGEEALSYAAKENKPVLVSIGYSSCHWCHVMAHECFEDEYIAKIMNQHFVCIKVDREERPDIDQIYMEAVQMINQHGGWPLNVFCLPDGRPFYGGTYFPPDDRGQGIMPWPQLLMRIAEYYQEKHDELRENAENIMANLSHLSQLATDEGLSWKVRDLLSCGKRITDSHDDVNGGFGGSPKFPSTMVLQFLMTLRQSRACGNEFPGLADRIDQNCQKTLERMARGGLFDQIGGGFCRYCVDAQWTIPHFEKMLYDNALLIETYAIGWSHYRQGIYQQVVQDTIDWLQREMRLENGMYAASLDADTAEGEGTYYCWTPEQIKSLLPETEVDRFLEAYRITGEGNFEGGLSYPQMDGSLSDREALKPCREILMTERAKRPAPTRDDKALTFWNALLARSFLTAGAVWNNEEWYQLGYDLLETIWTQCWDGETLYSQAKSNTGESTLVEGFLDDYATLAQTMVLAAAREDILGSERCEQFLQRGKTLAEIILTQFPQEGGLSYYFTSSRAESPLLRRTEWYDNATPAGNSTVVHLFSSLYFLTGDKKWAEALEKARPAFANFIEKVPNAIAYALAGYTQEALGLASVTAASHQELSETGKALSSRCWRPVWLRTNPEHKKEGIIVCVATTCLPPEDSPKEAARQIGFPPRRT